jgi:hypothetical protein
MKITGSILAGLVAAGLLAGCGGGDAPRHPAPVGSPGNPVPAKPESEGAAGSEGAAAVKPGYAKLLQKQTSKPTSRFTPCNLVTRAQAGKILRSVVDQPVEAPLGPTCLYRTHDRRSLVTLAVKTQSFTSAARQVDGAASLRVGGRRAVCGKLGGSVLYVSLPHGQMLSVAGPCVAAQKFAEKAVGRLAR